MARVQLNSLPVGTILQVGTFLPAVGASINVYTHGTVTPVTVFSTEGGAGTLSQPLTADANGQLPGWVTAGQTLDVSGTYLGGPATAGMAEAVDGSQITGPVNTQSGTYAIVATDRVVLLNATGGGFTVTLPTAVAFNGVYWLRAIHTNTNVVTLATTGGQTVNGGASGSITLGPPGSGATLQSATLVSDNANWWTV